MIQHLCKTTAKLWHNVLAGSIFALQAPWLLQMMRMDRASIHNIHVPRSLKDQLAAPTIPKCYHYLEAANIAELRCHPKDLLRYEAIWLIISVIFYSSSPNIIHVNISTSQWCV